MGILREAAEAQARVELLESVLCGIAFYLGQCCDAHYYWGGEPEDSFSTVVQKVTGEYP